MAKTKSTSRKKKLAHDIARSGHREYVSYLNSTSRILYSNVLAGMARGFGFVVGATIVVTLVTIIIGHLADVPIIGVFFAWLKDMIGNGTPSTSL